jgi:hypothetical protein
MIIKFCGKTPIERYYNIGVENNNDTDVIEFQLDKAQKTINLDDYTPCLKMQNKTFADKDYTLIKVDNADKIILRYSLKDAITQQKNVEMQLEFQNNANDTSTPRIWQTDIFNVNFSNTLNVSEIVKTYYPDILVFIRKSLDMVIEFLQNNGADISYENVSTAEQIRKHDISPP